MVNVGEFGHHFWCKEAFLEAAQNPLFKLIDLDGMGVFANTFVSVASTPVPLWLDDSNRAVA